MHELVAFMLPAALVTSLVGGKPPQVRGCRVRLVCGTGREVAQVVDQAEWR